MRNMSLLVAEGALIYLDIIYHISYIHGHSLEVAAGKRRSPSLPLSGPWSARANGVSLRWVTQNLWILLFRTWWPHHFKRNLPGGKSFVSFLFCSATGSPAIGTQNLPKNTQQIVSFLSRFQEGENNTVIINNAQISFNCTNFINARLTQCIFSVLPRGLTRSWRNGDAQCCQLSNIADPFCNFSPQKSAQAVFSLWESPVLLHEHEVLLSQHAHTPLSLSLSLSLCLSAQFLFSTRTHISLSLHVCSVSVQRAHTHLSLSLCTAQFLFSVHTSLSLSLSLSLSASAQFLFSARQRRAELNSVKHRY